MKTYTFKMGLVWAGISIAFFFLCMAWGLLLTDPTLQTLHRNLLQIAYPGFSMSIVGAIFGLLWATAYGFFFGVLFVWLMKVCCVHKHS